MNITLSRRWIKLILASISDQALYSLPNFVFNILLARWMSSEEFGAFAFGFSFFLFFSGFESALILEPMTVLGPVKYKQNISTYLKSLIQLHLIVGFSMALLGLILSFIVKDFSFEISKGIFGASLSTPLILLFWLARRACYLYEKPEIAVIAGLIYTLTLSFTFIYRLLLPINVISAFLLMALASLLASIQVWVLLHPELKKITKVSVSVKDIWPDHWHYGRWVVGSAFVYWIAYSITVPAIGIFLGLAHSGIFRALQNLVLPLQQIGTALATLFTPWLSNQSRIFSKSQFRQKSKQLIFVFFFIGFTYFIALTIANQEVIKFIYNNPEYQGYSWLVIYLGIYALLDQLSTGLSVSLRAIQKPGSIFWAQLCSAFLSITVNLFLIKTLGIIGAAYGLIITSATIMVVLIFHFVKYIGTETT